MQLTISQCLKFTTNAGDLFHAFVVTSNCGAVKSPASAEAPSLSKEGKVVAISAS